MFTNSLIKWLLVDVMKVQSNEETATKQIDYSANDSFEKRIYDDLCEDILEFLPLKDKIRLRGVSRQFRECLHNVWLRQRVVKVDHDLSNDRHNLIKGKTIVDRRTGILLALHSADELLQRLIPVEVNGFDRLLQIFPNTNCLHFGKYTSIADKNKILETIIQYCTRVESFTFELTDVKPQLIEEFGQKFGKQLKSIEFGGDVSEMPFATQSLLKHCPNVKSLVNITFDYLFDDKEILVKNLRKFKSSDIRDKRQFLSLVRHNPNLSHLILGFNLNNIQHTIEVFNSLSKLKELKVLSIFFVDFESYDRRIAKCFEEIGLNCKNLKNFSLRVEFVNSFDAKHCFESFKSFTSLKRLSFRLRSTAESDSGKLDAIVLRNCHQLTHLDIKCDLIDDNFFDGIQYLTPKLKDLKIKTKEEITDNSMLSIAKLRRLEGLIINRDSKKDLKRITDSGVLSVINGCQRIHFFEIHNEIGISDIAVRALIRKAYRNEKTQFKYYIEGIENTFNIERIAGGNGLPSNLVIKGKSFYKRRH